jgi:hypothetical protein
MSELLLAWESVLSPLVLWGTTVVVVVIVITLGAVGALVLGAEAVDDYRKGRW